MSRGAFSLGWQEIASVLCSTEADRRRAPQKHSGRRTIPQETVRAIRQEAAVQGASLREIAAKYQVSYAYAYNIVHHGLRDDEREVFR